MRWTRAHILTAAAAVVVVAGGASAAILIARPATPALHHGPVVRPVPVVSPPTFQPVASHRLVSPFTGEPIKSLRPELAVKIDNIIFARPQTGINSADIVYVLPVEGGLTRFLTIFSSHIPPVIGPVRSARQDDLELLHQFGRAFAFSGAQPELLPVVERAHIVNLYAGVVNGYFRDNSRVAPYNLFAQSKVLLSEAKHASKAHSIGFTFGRAPAGGYRLTAKTVTYPAASYTFRWSSSRKRWLVWIDGRRAMTTEGQQMDPTTVVIQYTNVITSVFKEEGLRPPYAETVGHGTVLVLRGGRAYPGHWSRPGQYRGTTFTTDGGQPLHFAPGQVWVVLTAKNKVGFNNERQ